MHPENYPSQTPCPKCRQLMRFVAIESSESISAVLAITKKGESEPAAHELGMLSSLFW